MTHPADEIRNAANKLRSGMWTIHPDIAIPLAKVMDGFAATEFDPEATVQETDGSHRRMLDLARAINGKTRTGMQVTVHPAPAGHDDAYARGFAAGRRAR